MMINDVKEAVSDDLSVGLQAALSSLPDEVVKEVQVGVSETEGKSENEKKLDLIHEQEALIKKEREEEDIARKAGVPSIQQRVNRAREKAAVVHGDQEAEAALLKEINAIRLETLTKEQISALSDAVGLLSKSSIVAEEREDLEDLKEDHKDYTKGVEDLRAVPNLTISKGSQRLTKILDRMIKKIDVDMQKVGAFTLLPHPLEIARYLPCVFFFTGGKGRQRG